MAVHTHLSRGEIEDFLHGYDLPSLARASGIRAGIENTNYRVELEGGAKYILTLFERRVLARDLPFFIGLMQHLSHSLPVPKPLACRDGKVIRTLRGRHATLITFLKGKSAHTIQNTHIAALGEMLARLHLAGRGFKKTRKNDLSLAGWKALSAKIFTTPGKAKEMVRVVRTELKFLERHWPKDLPRGVIHADLFPDNVFFDARGRLSGMIDFYFACNDFFAYDLAVCINAWCFEREKRWNGSKAKLLLESYHAVRPLTAKELAAMPVLLRGAATRFLLTRAHDRLFTKTSEYVTHKDPAEYLHKLNFFRQKGSKQWAEVVSKIAQRRPDKMVAKQKKPG
jgi:homoserine kinase type II